MITHEQWKVIPGYENYEISNMGNVRNTNYHRMGITKMLRPKITNTGYLEVELCKNCTKKSIRVHQLVAQAFIENPNNYSSINHKDENKKNNMVDNLEWCTAAYNNNYGTHNYRVGIALKNRTDHSKPIIAKDANGKELYFPSIKEAERILGVDHSGVCKVLKGKYERMYGYEWRYAE